MFTLNHARPKLLLVNVEFLPLIEQLQGQLESVEGIILMSDGDVFPDSPIRAVGHYEEMLAKSSPDFTFEDFDENTRPCFTPREPPARPRVSTSAIASLCFTH